MVKASCWHRDTGLASAVHRLSPLSVVTFAASILRFQRFWLCTSGTVHLAGFFRIASFGLPQIVMRWDFHLFFSAVVNASTAADRASRSTIATLIFAMPGECRTTHPEYGLLARRSFSGTLCAGDAGQPDAGQWVEATSAQSAEFFATPVRCAGSSNWLKEAVRTCNSPAPLHQQRLATVPRPFRAVRCQTARNTRAL